MKSLSNVYEKKLKESYKDACLLAKMRDGMMQVTHFRQKPLVIQ